MQAKTSAGRGKIVGLAIGVSLVTAIAAYYAGTIMNGVVSPQASALVAQVGGLEQTNGELQSQVAKPAISGPHTSATSNGAKVVNMDALASYLEESTIAGQTVRLGIIRSGVQTRVSVVLGAAG